MASSSRSSFLCSTLRLEKLSLCRFGMGPEEFPLKMSITDTNTDGTAISSNIPNHS